MTCTRSETWNFNVTDNRIIFISNLSKILGDYHKYYGQIFEYI